MVKRSREDSPPSSPSTLCSDKSTLETTFGAPNLSEASIHSSKYLHILPEVSHPPDGMKCSLPPHQETLVFSTFEEFEIHYAKSHANRCSECLRNFPTDHFLGLHIAENHDPLREARRVRGEKTYCCFVEGCDKICLNPQKRRMHLIDKHMFPKNYDFLIVNSGIDKRSSMLRSHHRKLSSAASRALSRDQKLMIPSTGGDAGQSDLVSSPPERLINQGDSAQVSESKEFAERSIGSLPSADVAVEDLTSTMSNLKFVPPSVRFGRGGRRGGFSRS